MWGYAGASGVVRGDVPAAVATAVRVLVFHVEAAGSQRPVVKQAGDGCHVRGGQGSPAQNFQPKGLQSTDKIESVGDQDLVERWLEVWKTNNQLLESPDGPVLQVGVTVTSCGELVRGHEFLFLYPPTKKFLPFGEKKKPPWLVGHTGTGNPSRWHPLAFETCRMRGAR